MVFLLWTNLSPSFPHLFFHFPGPSLLQLFFCQKNWQKFLELVCILFSFFFSLFCIHCVVRKIHNNVTEGVSSFLRFLVFLGSAKKNSLSVWIYLFALATVSITTLNFPSPKLQVYCRHLCSGGWHEGGQYTVAWVILWLPENQPTLCGTEKRANIHYILWFSCSIFCFRFLWEIHSRVEAKQKNVWYI